MKYSYSFYNIVVKETVHHVYLYNSLTGAFCQLEKNIHAIIANTFIDETNKCVPFDKLLKHGFIKPCYLDEYNKIRLNESKTKLERGCNKQTFVIAPTLSCNLNCHYCFEINHKNDKMMTKEIVFAIADYIIEHLENTTKHIHIIWFGGEPLLAYDTILCFNQYFKRLVANLSINYTARIITNGLLLDEVKIKVLSDQCAVNSMQITVDGTREIYCSKKNATAEQYDKLLQNIKVALNYCRISIRLNCDGSNYEDLKNVSQELVNICDCHQNLSFYIEKLIDFQCCGESQYLTQAEFDAYKIDFEKYISKLLNKNYKKIIPKHAKCFCELSHINNLVFGPDGEIYKCEHDIGQEDKIIGHISSGLYFNDYLMKFIQNEPAKRCQKCKIYPLCLGGCPAQRPSLGDGNTCLYKKEYIESLLQGLID